MLVHRKAIICSERHFACFLLCNLKLLENKFQHQTTTLLLSLNIIISSIAVSMRDAVVAWGKWVVARLFFFSVQGKRTTWTNETWRDREREKTSHKVMAWEKCDFMANGKLIFAFLKAPSPRHLLPRPVSFNKSRIFVWRRSRKQQPWCSRTRWQWNSSRRL